MDNNLTLVTVKEAAARLQCSHTTIYNLLQSYTIKAWQSKPHFLVCLEELRKHPEFEPDPNLLSAEQAAELLGLTVKTTRAKMRQRGLTPPYQVDEIW